MAEAAEGSAVFAEAAPPAGSRCRDKVETCSSRAAHRPSLNVSKSRLDGAAAAYPCHRRYPHPILHASWRSLRPVHNRLRRARRSSSAAPTRSPSATSARSAAASAPRSRTRARVCATRARSSSSRRARPARSRRGAATGDAGHRSRASAAAGRRRAARRWPRLAARCAGRAAVHLDPVLSLWRVLAAPLLSLFPSLFTQRRLTCLAPHCW